MSDVAQWKNRFAEFTVVPSRSGAPTVVHVPTGMLIHSRMNPVAEAYEIAEANRLSDASVTVLLGGGLGYLAESILDVQGADHTVIVIEPDVDLIALSHSVRSRSVYASSPRIMMKRVLSPQEMAEKCSDIPGTANMIIAPYFESLASSKQNVLSGFLRILRSERASKVVYDPLVLRNAEMNKTCLILLPSALDVRQDNGKPVLVVGAGPSLDLCVQTIRELRDRFVVIAASGAVPPLQARGVEPDWVIALEGREIINRDLSALSPATRMVAFPSVHPGVLSAHMQHTFAGVRSDGSGLETRGGSSLVPALDFALHIASTDIALIGADLSAGNGIYAQNANRDAAVEPMVDPPKYLAMRTGLERLLGGRNLSNRKVFHVLDKGAVLSGTERLLPQHLDQILNRMAESEALSEREPSY
ncbi:DUF115 domain-containing protein [candidate division KSB1 bacterium]|nr:MAG: DUF115 domain-containing protein [candidate division KSB1 bacterium]